MPIPFRTQAIRRPATTRAVQGAAVHSIVGPSLPAVGRRTVEAAVRRTLEGHRTRGSQVLEFRKLDGDLCDLAVGSWRRSLPQSSPFPRRALAWRPPPPTKCATPGALKLARSLKQRRSK